MAKERVMYKDRYVTVKYSPRQDIYTLFFQSTRIDGGASFFFDQRLMDEFSANNMNHLSAGLGSIDREIYMDMSRSDVRRLHRAIKGTMETYLQGLSEFREKEDL